MHETSTCGVGTTTARKCIAVLVEVIAILREHLEQLLVVLRGLGDAAELRLVAVVAAEQRVRLLECAEHREVLVATLLAFLERRKGTQLAVRDVKNALTTK